jgi:hypothetical protein
VRGPDIGVGEVHRDVVDGAHDPYVRMHLAHPAHAVGEGDGFHGGGADEDGQLFAAVGGGAYEVVVAGVGRIELPEHQAVPVGLHAVASARSPRCAA